jgi:acyl-CoA reductase-like NAD-dependent aldehyde dehydrogenase
VIGGRETGEALLEEDLDGLFFTGSYSTGTAIATQLAGRLLRVGMELGGKDPLYICEDVDIAATAAAAADGAFYNNGQSCCAVERIYVHKQIYQAFVEAFVEHVKGFVVGDPLDENTYIGALTRGQAAISTLRAQVKDACAKGASLLCGGEPLMREGAYFAPTVLADTNHGMALMREESFGPVIGIQPVYQDEEAVTLMNDTAYGLTASVYTPDPRTGPQNSLADADRNRLLELLRSGQSPFALVWAGAFGPGINAFQIGNPGLCSAQSLALAGLRPVFEKALIYIN